ncbi:MAG: helix-turn-helix domain-containing protein [Bacilli bacterium]
MDTKLIGKTLESARDRKGLTKTEVSRILGCSKTTIKNYESGKGIQNFSYLISMITTYDLDVKDVLGIDYKSSLTNGESLLNKQARVMMAENVNRFNGRFNSSKPVPNGGLINSHENSALVFYNTLISSVDENILRDILSYMVYPSKENPYIDDKYFINETQSFFNDKGEEICEAKTMLDNCFYNDEDEQLYELKAMLAFQKLMKRIRKSKDIVKWIEYSEKKKQEIDNAQLANTINNYEQPDILSPKEYTKMNLSAKLDYEERKKEEEANTAKMINYRNKVRQIHEKNTSKKKDVLKNSK